MLNPSISAGLTSGWQELLRGRWVREGALKRFQGRCASPPRGLVTRKSPPLVVPGRLCRAWRCCAFGESWAERLAGEGRVVRGKVRVPTGYVIAMVKAFRVAEGRS